MLVAGLVLLCRSTPRAFFQSVLSDGLTFAGGATLFVWAPLRSALTRRRVLELLAADGWQRAPRREIARAGNDRTRPAGRRKESALSRTRGDPRRPGRGRRCAGSCSRLSSAGPACTPQAALDGQLAHRRDHGHRNRVGLCSQRLARAIEHVGRPGQGARACPAFRLFADRDAPEGSLVVRDPARPRRRRVDRRLDDLSVSCRRKSPAKLGPSAGSCSRAAGFVRAQAQSSTGSVDRRAIGLLVETVREPPGARAARCGPARPRAHRSRRHGAGLARRPANRRADRPVAPAAPGEPGLFEPLSRTLARTRPCRARAASAPRDRRSSPPRRAMATLASGVFSARRGDHIVALRFGQSAARKLSPRLELPHYLRHRSGRARHLAPRRAENCDGKDAR